MTTEFSRELAAHIDRAIAMLHDGGIVAFPTDTVYGIGALLDHPASLSRVFDVKGRDASKTLPILISSLIVVDRLARDVDDEVLELADSFWPGPLTIVFPAKPHLPAAVVADDDTIALRMPDHPIPLLLADACGGALPTTSANPSGTPSLRTANAVLAALGHDIDSVIDAGATPGEIASTIIRPEGSDLRILRSGAIGAKDIADVWKRIHAAGSVIGDRTDTA